ncbi:hypothetical protein KFU94_61540 [Chloroflexi bacterium TSY]|nr:hypothetical protein [Chloroflexi bacterium TSY]
MIAYRQFFHADEACFRLPELGLLAGNLSHLAAFSSSHTDWLLGSRACHSRLRRVLESFSNS